MVGRIYTDGAPNAPDRPSTSANRSGMGGCTLSSHQAIDPRGNVPAYADRSTQVTERIRLRDRTHLQIDTVVEDPVALTAPWRYSRVYERIAPRFFENHCQDNNRDVNGDEPNLTPPENQP